ncbi:MAG: hypothetical protein ACXV7F_12970 [Methylomonas sp.]
MRLITSILAIFLCGFSAWVGAAESHCATDELVVFNCSLGKKIVSVCASKSISATSGYLQYRFGPKGSPELIYPADKTVPNADILAETLSFAGGGGAYIRFKRGRYGYVVYTAIGRGWGEKAGLVVEKNLKLQAHLPCQLPVQSELGPDFFEQAGLSKDPIGFELP